MRGKLFSRVACSLVTFLVLRGGLALTLTPKSRSGAKKKTNKVERESWVALKPPPQKSAVLFSRINLNFAMDSEKYSWFHCIPRNGFPVTLVVYWVRGLLFVVEYPD